MGYSQGPKETILVADPIFLFNLTIPIAQSIAGFYGIIRWPHSPIALLQPDYSPPYTYSQRWLRCFILREPGGRSW